MTSQNVVILDDLDNENGSLSRWSVELIIMFWVIVLNVYDGIDDDDDADEEDCLVNWSLMDGSIDVSNEDNER